MNQDARDEGEDVGPRAAVADGPPLADLAEMIWAADVPSLWARRDPDGVAIVDVDNHRTLSWKALDRLADAFARLMANARVGPGEKVGYLGRNSALFAPAFFGALRGGFTLVPLNWRCTAAELNYMAHDCGVTVLLHDADFEAVATGVAAAMQPAPVLMNVEHPDAAQDLMTRLEAIDAPPTRAAHDFVALLLYTSGTTGKPKGAEISHHALSVARHAELCAPDWRDWPAGGVSLSAMPNFHIGGTSWMLLSLIRGAKVIMTGNASPDHLVDLARRYAVDRAFLVPTVVRGVVDLLRSQGGRLPIRTLYYGAAPIGEGLLNAAIETLGCGFAQFFGMTEIAGAATFLPPHAHDLGRPDRLKSVGLPYPGTTIEIRDASGSRLNLEESGEIWIRSPTVMRGYLNRPEATAEVLIDGWYRTGDGGRLDAGGYLYLTDRIRDMIVSGGENIYPVEVEDVLRRHESVLDVAVVGMPDPVYGETVGAMVELAASSTLTAEALTEFARTLLAGYKCPRIVRFTPALPRTASGKVQRAKVKVMMADLFEGRA